MIQLFKTIILNLLASKFVKYFKSLFQSKSTNAPAQVAVTVPRPVGADGDQKSETKVLPTSESSTGVNQNTEAK